ncbi:signal peptidase complex-like protein DTM1 [Tanacetum coccineum]
MFGIGGIVLPDWEFFDRPVSEWTSPLSVAHMPPANSPPTPSSGSMMNLVFKFYPVRTIIYIMVYGFAFYRWWMYIST